MEGGGGGKLELHGWRIETKKSPILTSSEAEQFQRDFDMPSLPEMVHGGAVVRFQHVTSQRGIAFSALDALKQWRSQCFLRPAPKVYHSKAWQQERTDVLADVPTKEYDWTFFSDYSGTLLGPNEPQLENTDLSIPYERLKLQEQILLFESMVLFQDELHDNGDCMETVRVRVMPSGFFCLHRIFLRVDHVQLTMHDTRIYHAFGTDYLLHEFQVRSNTYAELQKLNKLPSDPHLIADENHMYEALEKKSVVTKLLRIPKESK